MSDRKYVPTTDDLATLDAMKAGFEATFQTLIDDAVLTSKDKSGIANRIKRQVVPLVQEFDEAIAAFEESLETIRRKTEELERSIETSVERKSDPAAEKLNHVKQGMAQTYGTGRGFSEGFRGMITTALARKANVAVQALDARDELVVNEIMQESGLKDLCQRSVTVCLRKG